MLRVADYFARFLAERGIETMYMVSGGMMMHLMDAVARIPSIRYYCNHHEQASAMAADAYARVSGRPGLCLATGGPGGTNVMTGLVGAWQDSIPVIFLTGQSKVRDTVRGNGISGLRQYGFLEVDVIPLVESVTKYAAFVDRPDQARFHMEKAYHLAVTGRPGPVLLDVPLDIQGALIDPSKQIGFVPPSDCAAAGDSDFVKMMNVIQRAERPLILGGHGVRCAGAVTSFRRLVDLLGVPVVTTQLGKDLLPYDNPCFVGHPGVKGNRAANFAVQSADVILVLGSSLHNQTIGWEAELFAPNAYKIHIDPDAAILQKTRPFVSEQLQCRVDASVQSLLEIAVAQQRRGEHIAKWRQQCEKWKEKYACMKEPHQLGPIGGPANLYEVMDILSDILTGNEIILSDAGQPTYVVPQALRLRESQRYLAPGSLCEMGWALPAAIGASSAAPGIPVIAIVGDGSFQTNIQELQTIRHNNTNVKLIVINNGGYASIRSTQARFCNGLYAGSTAESGVTLPELEKVAACYNIPYIHCPNRGSLRAAMTQMLEMDGPVICEVIGQTDQDVIPGVASVRLPDGRMRSASLEQMSPPIPEDVCIDIHEGTPAKGSNATPSASELSASAVSG